MENHLYKLKALIFLSLSTFVLGYGQLMAQSESFQTGTLVFPAEQSGQFMLTQGDWEALPNFNLPDYEITGADMIVQSVSPSVPALVSEGDMVEIVYTYTYFNTQSQVIAEHTKKFNLIVSRSASCGAFFGPDNLPLPSNIVLNCSLDSSIFYAPAQVLHAQGAAPGAGISVSDVTISGPCPNSFTILRTWTFTDVIQDECVQTIIVQDNQAPQFIYQNVLGNFPNDTLLPCDQLDAYLVNNLVSANQGADGLLWAVDNCLGTDVMFLYLGEEYIQNENVFECPGQYEVVRSWRAQDDCGNFIVQTQRVILVDLANPVATQPTDITVECSEDANADFTSSVYVQINDFEATITTGTGLFQSTVSATDDCGIDTILVSIVGPIAGDCPNEFSYLRIWTVIDVCGNETTVTQTISFEDTTPPVFVNFPADEEYLCLFQVPVPVVPTAVDNCADVEPILSETVIDSVCPNQLTILRTWTINDGCNDPVSQTQTIVVFDDELPKITVAEGPFYIGCSSSSEPADILNSQPTSVTDNCGFTESFYFDVILDGDYCLEEFGILRHWYAIDDCGNFSDTTIQTILIVDLEAPTFTVPPSITVSCPEDTIPSITGFPTNLNDDCTASENLLVSYEDEIISGGGVGGLVTTVGFTGSFAPANWTFDPNVGVTPGNGTVNVSNAPASISITGADYPDGDFPPSANFNRAELCIALDFPAVIKFDWDYNSSDINQIASVDPFGYSLNGDYFVLTSGGACTTTSGAPEQSSSFNQAFQAGDVFCFSQASCDRIAGSATTTISNFEVTESTPSEGNDCEFVVTRTWIVEDECGRRTKQPQTIIVQDEAPVIVAPANITVACITDTMPSITGFPIEAFDDCTLDPVVTYQDGNFLEVNCITTFVRTWTITDDCGKSASDQQVITVKDSIPPTFTFPPVQITVSCENQPLEEPEWINLADNCTPVEDLFLDIIYLDTITDGCTVTITRRFRVADACGNFTQSTQTIIIVDETPPTLTIPGDVTIDCTEADDIYPPVSVGVVTVYECESTQSVTASGFAGPYAPANWTFDPNVGQSPGNGTVNVSNAPMSISITGADYPDGDFPPSAVFNRAELCVTLSSATVISFDWNYISSDINQIASVDPFGYSLNGNFFAITSGGACTTTAGAPEQNSSFSESFAAGDVFCFSQASCDRIAGSATTTISNFSASTVVEGDDCIAFSTDNCADPVITYIDVISGDCEDNYTITRTWTASDDCDNTTTLVQIITVIDDEAPTLVIPADYTVECDMLENTLEPALSLDSETEYDLGSGVSVNGFNNQFAHSNWTFDPNVGVQPGNGTISLNPNNMQIAITGADYPDGDFPPSAEFNRAEYCITMPSSATVSFDWNYVSNDFNAVASLDPFGYSLNGTYNVITDGGACTDFAGAVNQSGSFSMYVEAGTVFCFSQASCDRISGSATTTISNFSASSEFVSDNCDPAPVVTYMDMIQAGDCEDNYTIVRTWTATDRCGNSTSDVQLITVIDTTPPVLVPPASETFACDDLESIDPPISYNVAVEYDFPAGDIVLTGFTGDYAVGNWTFDPNVGVSPGNGTVNTGSAPNFIIITGADYPLGDFPPSAEFNRAELCIQVPESAFLIFDWSYASEDINMVASLDPFGYSLNGVFNVVTAGGACDAIGGSPNQNGTSSVSVAGGDVFCFSQASCDRIAGAASTVISNFRIAGQSVSDNCDPAPVVTYMDEKIDGSCDGNYTIVRTYTATDRCGNSTQATQQINIIDTVPPTFVIPADITLECTDIINVTGNIEDIIAVAGDISEVEDNCSEPITIDVQIIVSPDCGLTGTITRIWTVTDDCGNSASGQQTITIEDTTPPTLHCPNDVVADADENCEAFVNIDSVFAVDECVISGLTGTYSHTLMQEMTCTDDESGEVVQEFNGFTGPFAPANWTFDPNVGVEPGNGTVNLMGAPNTISITGADYEDGDFPPSAEFNRAELCVTLSANGIISFDWDYISSDFNAVASLDPFGYSLNGDFFPITDGGACTDFAGAVVQNGSFNLTLGIGDVFCFAQASCDRISGSATTTLSNFSFTTGGTCNPDIPVDDMTFEFINPPKKAVSDATLSLVITGDLEHWGAGSLPSNSDTTEFFNVYGENGTFLGKTLPSVSAGGDGQCGTSELEITIPMELFNAWLQTDDNIVIFLENNIPADLPGSYAINKICPNNVVDMTLTYDFELISPQIIITNSYNNNGPDASDIYPLGVTEVWFYAMDDCGNIDSCMITVTVEDNTPPVLECPADTTLYVDADSCCIYAVLDRPTLFENCGFEEDYNQTTDVQLIPFTDDPNLGAFIPGTMTFEFTNLPQYPSLPVSDATLTVYVRGDIDSVFTDEGITTLATSYENFIVVSPTGLELGVTAFGEKCGAYSVVEFILPLAYLQNNFEGMSSVSFSLVPNVGDIPTNLPNDITGLSTINPCNMTGFNPGDIAKTDGFSSAYMHLEFQATTLAWFTTGATELNGFGIAEGIFNTGSTVIHYVATDNVGNIDTCSFNLTVLDTIAPEAICQKTTIFVPTCGCGPYILDPREVNGGYRIQNFLDANGMFVDVDSIVGGHPYQPDGCTGYLNGTPDSVGLSRDNCGIDSMWVYPNEFTCDMAGDSVMVTLYVMDYSGNISSCTVPIRIENEKPVPSYNLGICDNDTLRLYANPPSPDFNYNYTFYWEGPAGFTSTLKNPVIPSIDQTNQGTYSVTITGVTGCTASGEVQVVIPDQPNTPIISGPDAVCSNDFVLFQTLPYTGLAPTFSWYLDVAPQGADENDILLGVTNVPSFILENPVSGFYYVIVSDEGCESNPSNLHYLNVSYVIDPEISSNGTEFCEGDEIVLYTTVSADGYIWTGPNGFISFDQSPSVIVNAHPVLHSGNYYLQTVSGECVSGADTITIMVNPQPKTPAISHNSPACEGDTITLCVSEIADTYHWIPPSGSTSETSIIITTDNCLDITEAGNWTVFTMIGDCYSEVSNPVEAIFNPIPHAVPTNNGPICVGENGQFYGGPQPHGAVYNWYNAIGNLVSTEVNPVVVLPQDTITWSLVVTLNGCSSEPVSSTLIVNPLPEATASANYSNEDNGENCSGADLMLFASGGDAGASYTWTGPSGFTSSAQNPVISNADASNNGNYQVVVTNTTGCVASASVFINNIINVPAKPLITAMGSGCEGQMIVLSTQMYSGVHVTYSWTLPNGDIINTGGNVLVLNPSSADLHNGNYVVTVNVDGCVNSSDPYFVQVLDKPVISSCTSNDSTLICIGAGEVLHLTCEVSGGTGALSYLWTGPNGFSSTQQSPMLFNVSSQQSGTYTLLVTDAAGCTAVTSTQVTISTIPNQPIITGVGQGCEGQTGVLTVLGEFGSSVEYSWTTPSGAIVTGTNQLVVNPTTPADSGLYTVTVIVNGCENTSSPYHFVVYEKPSVEIPSSLSFECVIPGQSIQLNAFTAAPPANLTYAWSGPNGFISFMPNPTIPNVSAASAGEYVLTVTNQTGCYSIPTSVMVNITFPPAPPVIQLSTPSVVCEGDIIQLYSATNYAGSSVTYTWTLPNGTAVNTTTPTLTILNADPAIHNGVYAMSVTVDDCGSQISNEIVVTVTPTPDAPVASNTTSSTEPACEGESVQLSTGFVPGATYSWTGPNNFTSGLQNPLLTNVSALNTGVYTVVITVNGCSSDGTPGGVSSTTVFITQTPPTPTVVNDGPGCIGGEITLSVTNPSEIVSPTVVQWYSAATNVMIGTGQTLTLTDLTMDDAGGYYAILVNGGCQSAASNVTVVEIWPANQAYAGEDQELCGQFWTQLSASSPSFGTGTWTTSGSAVITNPNDPNTTVFNLSAGDNVFVWTLDNPACFDVSTDEVVISVTPEADDIADAGLNQILCAESEATLSAISSTTPGVVGTWTQSQSQENQGVVIVNPNSPTTQVTGLDPAGGVYMFTWTLNNGACGDYSNDEITVTVVPESFDIAFAGEDQFVCDSDIAMLQAEIIITGTGFWTSVNPEVNVISPNQPHTVVTNLQDGPNVFYWTISNSACGETSVDSVTVTRITAPIANDDEYTVDPQPGQSIIVTGDVTDNDDLFFSNSGTVALVSGPDFGMLTLNEDGTFNLMVGSGFGGATSFVYQLCSDECPSLCATATVTIVVGTSALDCVVPNIITPNGDGVNDALVIPCLNEFPNNQIAIFNRWGDEVYRAAPYNNNWEGTYLGNDLPTGTYFYVLQYDSNGDGNFDEELQGYVVIHR